MSDPEVIYESYGNKLIGAGATGGGSSEQVQADWEQSDTTAPDYIKNKPSLSEVATSGDYEDLSNKPSTTSNVTSGSTALVTSGGVHSAIHDDIITVEVQYICTVSTAGYFGNMRLTLPVPDGYSVIALFANTLMTAGVNGHLNLNVHLYENGDNKYAVLGWYTPIAFSDPNYGKVKVTALCKKN